MSSSLLRFRCKTSPITTERGAEYFWRRTPILPLLLDNRRRLLGVDVPERQELLVEFLCLAALVVLVEFLVEEIAEALVVFAPNARARGKRDDRLGNHHLAFLHARLLHNKCGVIKR